MEAYPTICFNIVQTFSYFFSNLLYLLQPPPTFSDFLEPSENGLLGGPGNLSKTFQTIPKHSNTFQNIKNIQTHSNTFKHINKHKRHTQTDNVVELEAFFPYVVYMFLTCSYFLFCSRNCSYFLLRVPTFSQTFSMFSTLPTFSNLLRHSTTFKNIE